MNTFEMLRIFSYEVLSGRGLSDRHYELLGKAEEELHIKIGELQEQLATIESIRKLCPKLGV